MIIVTAIVLLLYLKIKELLERARASRRAAPKCVPPEVKEVGRVDFSFQFFK